MQNRTESNKAELQMKRPSTLCSLRKIGPVNTGSATGVLEGNIDSEVTTAVDVVVLHCSSSNKMDDTKMESESRMTKFPDRNRSDFPMYHSENRCNLDNSELMCNEVEQEKNRSSEEDLFACFPCELLKRTPPDIKDRHRQALLQIFATSLNSADRFSSFISRSIGKTEKFVDGKNMGKGWNKLKSRRRKASSFELDRELPQKLAQLTGIVCQDKIKATRDSLNLKTCIGLTLTDLELNTRQWYLSTVESQKKNKVGGSSNQTFKDRNDSGRSASFFSLKYNEGSLSTISKWCCSRDSKTVQSNVSPSPVAPSKTGRNVTSKASPRLGVSKVGLVSKNMVKSGYSKYPTVDKRYRKCSICKHWGHYEVECSKVSFTEAIYFADLLQLSRSSVSEKAAQAQLVGSKVAVSRQAVNSNITSARYKDRMVTLELFGGYMFEQRSQPEKRIRTASSECISEDVVLSYDDSFIVDGFALKAATSLNDLRSGEASSRTLSRKTITKKRVSTTDIDSDHFRHLRSVEFFDGDLVAWYEKSNPCDDCYGQTVHTGYVVKGSKQENPNGDNSMAESVCVESLTSIPYSPESTLLEKKLGNISNDATFTPEKADPHSGCGSRSWIPIGDLFLVKEVARFIDADDVRGKKRKYNARKKIESFRSTTQQEDLSSIAKSPAKIQNSIKVSKSRSMPYSERFKESGRVQSKDMSLAPRKPARKLADGTYSMPQGRRPVGLDWDHTRGFWVVPKKRRIKKPKSR